MRRVKPASVLTMRRSVALVGASLSLLLIPAVASTAKPASSTMPRPTTSAPTPGITLHLGGATLTVPLSLNLGALQLGSGTSTPPTSSSRSTTPAPPTSHHPSRPPTHGHPTSAVPPPNTGGGFPPLAGGGNSSPSAPRPTHQPTSASASKDTKGTGSLELTQRLLGNGGVLMLAALLAGTALAVLAFARLGGVRGRGSTRRH